MTTIGVAAVLRAPRGGVLAALTACAGLALAGCETGTSIFGPPASPEANAAPAAQATPAAPQARIAVAPIIGAPEAVGKQIQQDFTSAIEKQRIAVATGKDDKVDYTLRGYIVAAKEKTAVKVSYIWDVTDPTGKRVNRITGEEVAPGTSAKDPWSAVTPAVAQSVAAKAASSFTAWLPSHGNQAAIAANAAAQPAGVGVQSTPSAAAPAVAAAPAPGRAETPARPETSAPPRTETAATAAQGPTTGSIGGDGQVTALVPSVTGAPGDGGTSLTGALQRELTKSGVTLANKTSPNTYSVEGKVTLGQANDGKQPIQIDWLVKDPQGKRLGTVSQKNEIPEGSLDGQWGKTADAAASAAAQGIVKLLPQAKAQN